MYLSLDVQWFVIEMQHLLHKGHIDKWGNIKLRLHDPKVMSWPWNSSSKKIWIKSFKWIDFSQVAAKISKVKVGGWKKSARSAGSRAYQSRIWLSRQFFIDLQLWPLIFLLPLDLQERTVPNLKDLIHICLEPEAQGYSSTFKVWNFGSK